MGPEPYAPDPACYTQYSRAGVDDGKGTLAWLGLIALVGFGACCLDALLQALGSRRDRLRRAEGRPVRGRSRRVIARLVPFVVAAVLLGSVWAVTLAGSGGGGSAGSPPATTLRLDSSSTRTTTTTSAGGERTPPQVRVAVLNASPVAGVAATEATALLDAGYVVIGPSDVAVRAGRAVQCAPGFEREAVTLVMRLGGGAVVEAFPRTVPASAAGADCLVTLGA